MNKLLFFYPIIGSFIAIIAVFIAYYCLWRRLNKSKMQIIQIVKDRFGQPDIQLEIDQNLDMQLDTFIQNLRDQIPMGAMLLTPALSIKIRGLAKEGILKMLPDLKDQLFQRISEEIQIHTIILQLLRSDLIKIVIYSALSGFIIGLLSALFINWI